MLKVLQRAACLALVLFAGAASAQNFPSGPVRLIVPGWPGSVSAKWFTRLWVRDKIHDGPGMGATAESRSASVTMPS